MSADFSLPEEPEKRIPGDQRRFFSPPLRPRGEERATSRSASESGRSPEARLLLILISEASGGHPRPRSSGFVCSLEPTPPPLGASWLRLIGPGPPTKTPIRRPCLFKGLPTRTQVFLKLYVSVHGLAFSSARDRSCRQLNPELFGTAVQVFFQPFREVWLRSSVTCQGQENRGNLFLASLNSVPVCNGKH